MELQKNKMLLAAAWGAVISLSMMRISPGLFYTPIYVVALFAILNNENRREISSLGKKLPAFLLYFSFAVASLAWASSVNLVGEALREDILTPLLAMTASFYAAKKLTAQSTSRMLLFGAWTTFLFGTVFSYLKNGATEPLFESVGYYSSYVFFLAGASVPFLSSRTRVLFYPIVAGLLFLTHQRAAWIVFPLFGCVDLWLNRENFPNKKLLVTVAVLIIALSVTLLKVVAEQKPVDSSNPEVQAHNLAERLAKNERIKPWEDWIHRGMESPLAGQGFGRKNVENHFSTGDDWAERNLHHAHNIILNNFLQLGLLGALLYLAAQIQLIRFLLQHKSPLAIGATTVVAAFFLRNMFDDFSFQRILIVYALILGWCMGGIKPPEHTKEN